MSFISMWYQSILREWLEFTIYFPVQRCTHTRILVVVVHATSASSCQHVLPAAVKSIKRHHLVEMRTLANPPKMIKMAMESICLLIGEPATDWKAIRGVLLRDNFITTIINFSTDSIS